MADQRPDVVDPVSATRFSWKDVVSGGKGGADAPDHGRPLEADAPAVDVDVLREAHRRQHLWAEHAAVADFDPFVEERVEGEDLQRGLCGATI